MYTQKLVVQKKDQKYSTLNGKLYKIIPHNTTKMNNTYIMEKEQR